jgi:phage-related baseplate assembly protein
VTVTSAISSLDLSRLPAPNVVEALDFETIFAAMLADLRARDPIFDALVESDPAYKILEVAAYRELLVRQRVNDAARAVMLAFATGADLDQLGANKNVERLVLDPGDPDASPPIAPTYESDSDFRARIQLSPEGYTTAGSEGSYIFHGLSADADVKDVQAISPDPGVVDVYVLSRSGDGTASPELLDLVDATLNAADVRPLTDNVTVHSADVTAYQIEAELVMYPGPDAEVVRAAALAAVTQYAADVHRLGYDVTLSGLYAALHQPGVQRVNLAEPVATLVAGDGEAWFADDITVAAAALSDV